MKILHLRFANLNSLYGEWSIDFSAPEYSANGIFALTGPTGAGKSTILDAICLALYGATPRLGRITKSSNEIMARRTGTCFAEVVFATEGGTYQCHWGQHRARKKASGELQNPRHEISTVEVEMEGTVLENHLRRVSALVEKKTGMDFERFTRSMLLAQGGFDTFLRADVEQKSALLEQITGTGIYTDISRGVHERLRSEREALKVLEAHISGIQVLEPEQAAEISTQLETREKEEQKLSAALDSATRTLLWRKNLTALEQEVEALAQERASLDKEIAAFAPQRQRLELARQATELEGEYATLVGLRRQQQAEQEELTQGRKRIPELEHTTQQLQIHLKEAQQRYSSAKKEQRQTTQEVQQVRTLDQQLKDKLQNFNTLRAAYNADAEQIRTREEERNTAQQQADKLEHKLAQVEKKLKENHAVAALAPELAGIKAQLEQLEQLHREMRATEQRVEETTHELARATAEQEKHAQSLKQQRNRLDQAAQRVEEKRHTQQELLEGRKIAEYRREKDALQRELALLQRIAALEDQRALLQVGEACPLCGATEHPYASGNVPAQNETEAQIAQLETRIETAEALQQEIESLNATLEQVRTQVTRMETEAATLEHTRTRAREHREEGEKALTQLRQRCTALQQPLQARVEDFGGRFDPAAPHQSVAHLTQRVETWYTLEQRHTELHTTLAQAQSEVARIKAVLDTRRTALDEKQREVENARTAHAQLQEQRHSLFEDKDPTEVERRMQYKVDTEEQEQNQAQTRLNEAQQRLSEVRNRNETLVRQLEERRVELEHLEHQFRHRCEKAGFVTETAFNAARLETEARQNLEQENQHLQQRHLELHTRVQDRSARLEQERALNLTSSTLVELETQEVQLKTQLEEVRNISAGLRHQLREHAAAKERIRDKEAAIRTQRRQCLKWERLHGLIGSSDGKKFRNFAQGLTFDLMVNHANAQLSRMTERYLLIRDSAQPLELNVVDNYQAGEIRSTRNLSGGESFIVSLTLALGLSNMASRNIRIDSLFLDEGFGTLDEDTLETALEALAGLQQEGKLIGIISHVGGLKERIRTRIKVEPGSGGKSRLAGPGVKMHESK
ncbi:MAG: AAA family ATPase [Thermodesulfobacteriota bacterium]